MPRSLLPEEVERYVADEMTRESPLQQRLREETHALPMGMMQIGADQGALLKMLVHTVDARRAVEIGTFTGYSALAVARRCPPTASWCAAISATSGRASASDTGRKRASRRASTFAWGLPLATLDALLREYGAGTLRLRVHRRRQDAITTAITKRA